MPRYVPRGINIQQTPAPATVDIDLPPFIKPLPAKLKPCDRVYLRDSGAVTLPPPFFQRACLKVYVEYVHPYMPMMDVYSFLDAINDNGKDGNTVSLLLFQAVMFAGITFVDEEMMLRAGFVDRRKTRALFFERVKKLYQVECEDNDMALIQSLLLMTYYYESPQDRMDTWHWIGVAISLAQNLGLHRNPDALPMSPQNKALHKRVWWSCYMRDRLIALGMRRPTRIKDEDFNVPLLEESDFVIRSLSDDNNLLGPECTLLRDLDSQRELALMCIQKAKLCLIVSKMLKLQYSVLQEGALPTPGTDSMLIPKKDTSAQEVQLVDGLLESWLQNLPQSCHYVPLGTEEMPVGLGTLAVQRSLLHMVFYTAMSALHRPLFLNLNSGQQSSTPQQQQNFTQRRVRECADRVVEMVAGLRQHGMVQYLSTVGVTVILPAMIIKLFDMNNPNLVVGQRAYEDFTECMEAMHTLKTIYAAAEYAVRFMQQAFDKTRHGALAMAAAAQVSVGSHLHQHAYISQHQHSRQQLQRTLAPGLDIPSNMPENPSTPPPENISPFLGSSVQPNVFHAAHMSPGFGGSDYSMVDDQQTPPGTDEDSGTQGESPSSSSDQDMFGYDSVDYMPTGEIQGDVEFDQWITFNAEGVGNSGGEILDLNTSAGGFGFGNQGMWEQPAV
ncbi:fungal-specific transcription factor domain-containing protein [Cladorrhinum samala]|uniref:Fungal-specific transcription factor domain-containing protein n=1 Tax=Cladorrhinum samala TaxID=585594 RepID=A0AAV9I5S6_9PEZI|nr:fungal-specific transcription factor domain-containing protein [Cladorrhinum samala]